MINSLRVTLTHSEDLPTPLAVRLSLPSSTRVKQISFLKAFEAVAESPMRLKFYHAGEAVGVVSVRLVAVEEPQGKWLPVSPIESETDWSAYSGVPTSGPRVHLLLEPVCPLSPILEMTEANECSVVESRADAEGSEDPACDELQMTLQALQTERERNSAAQKELQLKVMELQQTLVKERWESRIAIEECDFRMKSEVSQAIIALEKNKNALKKEVALSECLAGKLDETEARLADVVQRYEAGEAGKSAELKAEIARLEDVLRRKSIEIGELSAKLSLSESTNSCLQLKLQEAENRLFDATSNLSRVRTDFEESLSASQSLSLELTNTKTVLKHLTDPSQSSSVPATSISTPSERRKSALVSMLESENTTLAQQLLETRKIVHRLKSELVSVQTEGERKDREVRNLTYIVESLKSKLNAYEMTIKVLKATEGGTEVRDLVDEALREYLQGRKTPYPFIRITEGMYSYGDRHVLISVKRGEILIKSRKGSVPIEDFLSNREEDSLQTVRKNSKANSESRHGRPKSVDLDRQQQHYRTMSNYIDLLAKQNENALDVSSSARVHTDQSCDYGGHSDRRAYQLIAKPRDPSPMRDYLKSTISSQQKTTSKPRMPAAGRKSRVMKM